MTATAQAIRLSAANAALNLDYSRACGGGANGERGWGKRVELVAASSHESKSFRGGGDQVQPGSKSERGKHTSAWAMQTVLFSEVSRIASAAGHCLEGILPERLKGPAAGAMHHHAAYRAGDQRSQFEQAYPQGLDLRLAQRRGQAVAKQRHQIVGAGVQQQTKGIGQKTLAAQTVGGKSVLQLSLIHISETTRRT